MQLSVCVRIETSSTRFEDLEAADLEAAHRAAREALEQACRRLERARGRRAGRGRGRRRRTILTRAGYLTIARGARAGPTAPGTSASTSDWAWPPTTRPPRGSGAGPFHLAATHPYREAVRLLSAEVGEVLDHAIWRWVQAEGARRRAAKDRGVRAMFEDGEAPPRPEEAPPITRRVRLPRRLATRRFATARGGRTISETVTMRKSATVPGLGIPGLSNRPFRSGRTGFWTASRRKDGAIVSWTSGFE